MILFLKSRSRHIGTYLCTNSIPLCHMLPKVASISRNITGVYDIQKYSAACFSSAKSMSTTSNITCTSFHVAFVGLGNMGINMALNIARKGNDDIDVHLTVHDLREPSVAKFLERAETLLDSNKLSIANDLAAVARSNPDFVITSLPSCEASEAVVVFIDTSTVSPTTARKLHQLVTSTSSNYDYVDAPVSGGVKGATEASLTFMVGCSSPKTLSSAKPLLQRMGKDVIPCGGPGSGSAVKLCNNSALAAQMLGICEAMNLGDALGVDPTVLAGVMNVSTAKCWSSLVNNPHPVAAKGIGSGASANGYDGGFGTALMLKDLNLAVDAGEEEGLAMPVAGLTRDLYRMADKHGHGKKDFGVMLQFLKGAGAAVE